MSGWACSVLSDSLQPHGLQSTRLLRLWDYPSENTGVGCHFLFQGTFLIQGLNLCLLHWQVDSLPLSHLGNPNQWAPLNKNNLKYRRSHAQNILCCIVSNREKVKSVTLVLKLQQIFSPEFIQPLRNAKEELWIMLMLKHQVKKVSTVESRA